MGTETIHTINTVAQQTYCLTASTACTIYTDINGEKVELAHTEGGQAYFTAPGKEVYSTAPCTITKFFKGAAPAVVGSGDRNTAKGDPFEYLDNTSTTLNMSHHMWYILSHTITRLTVMPRSPMPTKTRFVETYLLFTPSESLSPGWLHTPEGVSLFWLYGEPTFAPGYTYEILLTQRSENQITTCVTAITPYNKAD